MLNYSEFQPFQAGNRHNFKFKKLRPLSEERDIYAETTTNRKYHVSLFTNRNQVQILSELWKKGVWGNLKGLFKKKNMFYAISQVESLQTLGQYLEKFKSHRDQLTELFCLQLIESIVEMGSICEQMGCGIKILNPFFLILEQREGRWNCKLKYPYCHSMFQGLSCLVVSRQAQFCAPQILILMNKEFDLINQIFSKSVIYSLGLILLYCFGYRIKSQERILALKNSKQFTMFLKAIRKEIKVFHQGKFISKIIKILLEQSQEVRDNLQTFAIKLHSPQLQSLRKFVFRPDPIKDSYIPTIYSDHSEIFRKSRLNRTIEIQGSSNTSNKSENSSRENNEQVRQVCHFPTFRKSAENVFHKELGNDEASKQKQGRQMGSNGQLPSPIDIEIDWDDQEPEDIPYSTRRTMSPIKKHLAEHQNERSQEMQGRLSLGSRDKQKFSYSQGKKRSGPQRISKNSRIQQQWKIQEQVQNQNRQEDLLPQNMLKIQINENSLVNLSGKPKDTVEEEPEIIKYENPHNDPAHKPIKKKISHKQSVELQDMNLVEDQWEEEEAEEEPPNTKHQQLNVELNKKAEAVFIILLISFLIYKVIDYVIS